MDKVALETAQMLGTGPTQLVLAIGLVFFAGATIWLGRMLHVEMKSCHAVTLDMLTKKIESDNRLADAIEGSTRVTEAAIAAKRTP
jgi:hypothetical protein